MAKRQELSLQEKIEVLDKVKKQPPYSSQRELAEILIPRSTLTRLINKEEELRSRCCEVFCHGHKPAKKLKCLRKGKASEVDTALNQWFGTVTSKRQKLSGPILKKAENLAKKLAHTNFVATEGWLSRWKVRHQIRNYGHMERREVQTLIVLKSGQALFYQGYWIGLMRSIMQMKLGCITEPLLMAHFGHEKFSGSKKALERMTVLCCSNLTGTDKCKLLVIGKSLRPRCFKNVNVDNLPVTYRANKKAWMTSQIFTERLAAWDLYLTKVNLKILLLVDNCTAHPHVSTLKNIQLEFLPPNTTSLIQPMEDSLS